MIGTPSYMSPEQCRGEAVDARSDLFSTGVVLYELLSGKRPFTGRNMTEVAFQVMNQPPPDIVATDPGLPPSLVAAIHRALAKLPDDRFASADDMAAALRQTLRRAPNDRRTAQWCSRARRLHRCHIRHDRARTGEAYRPDRAPSGAERGAACKLAGGIARHRGAADRSAGTALPVPPGSDGRCQRPVGAPRPAGAGATGRTRTRGPCGADRPHPGEARSGGATSPDDFWQRLASHIEREADRQAFLRKRP